MRIVVVTAVEAERAAITGALPAAGSVAGSVDDLDVVVGGVGPAAAAAATAVALDGADLVLSAGIGGGFAPLVPGDIAVASAAVFADLGAETAQGFVPASELGLGGPQVERYDVAPALAIQLADRTGGHLGTVLTVATVTGTAAGAARLGARFPDAVAEGMEGAGVAAAARLRHVPFGEIRAISNTVGPRDREAWEIPRALHALGEAIARALR